MKEKITKVLNRVRNSRFASLLQFFRFGIVGLTNTAISYGIEMLGYYVLLRDVQINKDIKIILVNLIAFFISVTHSYYWNNRIVFISGTHKKKKQHLISYAKTVACYALTGLLLAPALKLWLNNSGVLYWVSSLATLILTVPLNFFLNKYWAFKTSNPEN